VADETDGESRPPADEDGASDDDWFERAFDDDSAAGAPDDPGDRGDLDDSNDPAAPDNSDDDGSETVDAIEDENDDDLGADSESESPSGSDPDSDVGADAETVEAAEARRRELFTEDFVEEFENAPSLPDLDDDSADSFGGFGGGGGENFGFGGDDDFGFGGADGPGGGPDARGPSGGRFGPDDEESFESNIERIKIGIEGLDEMILGGVPKRSLMVAIGSAGTGKTTFGLQFLHEALRNDEKAVYITLEENRDAILVTAEEKGWPFQQYEDDGDLAVLALDPIEMANSLASVRSDLPRLVDEFGADRLVLDSVSLLEMMYDHPSKRRSEVFDFTRALKEAGVTTMLTSEADRTNPYASRHGIVEYLTDAVFILQYVRPSDFRETRLAVEIQKIRDANHSRETKPYDITNEGISVYRQANIF
jgi:KaiC domain protein